MHTREEVIKLIEKIPDDELEGLFEYIKYIEEPDEVEPTEEELKAIEEGETAFKRGEFVRWRDIKTNAV